MDFTPGAQQPVPQRGINPTEPPMELVGGPLGAVRFSPIRGSRSAVIAVAVPVGSRDEKKGEEGAAHFLEHVLFKRTAAFDGATALWSAIETIGGEANAATDHELTTYYVDVPRSGLQEAAGILGEIVLASRYTSADIESERGVVIEEIRGLADDPDELVHAGIDAAIFGAGHMLARNVAGSVEAIKKLPEKAIRSFQARHYLPGTMSFAVAGDLNPGEVSRARDAFTRSLDLTARKAPMRPIRSLAKHPVSTPKPKGELLVATVDDIAQARLVLGVPSFARNHPDRPAINLLDSLLGGGSGSRLFIRLREEAGLAYDVDTDVFEFADAGTFVLSVGVDPSRLTEAADAMLGELRRLLSTDISEEELARAKGYAIGGIERFAADIEGTADWRAGEPLLVDTRFRRIEEEITAIRSVEADQVAAVAARLFRKGQLRFSVVAPSAAVRSFKTALGKGKFDL